MAQQGLIAMLVSPLWSAACVGDAQHQLSVLPPRLWEQGLDLCTLCGVLQDAQEHSTQEWYANGALGDWCD